MLETKDILETINMIDNENLDVRTITMGISLLDCIDDDIDKACTKVYDKICRSANFNQAAIEVAHSRSISCSETEDQFGRNIAQTGEQGDHAQNAQRLCA